LWEVRLKMDWAFCLIKCGKREKDQLFDRNHIRRDLFFWVCFLCGWESESTQWRDEHTFGTISDCDCSETSEQPLTRLTWTPSSQIQRFCALQSAPMDAHTE
jgi:hypothetical protein